MTEAPFFKTVLKNGIPLVAERHAASACVSIGVWVRVGSSDENPEHCGVSHFIEHMVFKGTRNRTAFEIASSLENIGGELNAFTEKELTCFHATVLAEHVEEALAVLSELVLRPTFPKAELEKERKVLLQELASVESSPEENIYDLFFRKVWNGHSMAHPIIGNRKTIQKISRAALTGFFADHYQPSRMVISIAGNIEFEEVTKLCEKHFDTKGVQESLPTKQTPLKFHHRHWFHRAETDQVHALVGFPTEGVGSSKRYAYLLLSYLLGGGMGSRLFQKVREDAALAYSVECDFVPFSLGGIFTVYAGMASRSLGHGLEVIGRVLCDVAESELTEADLDKVKRQLRGMILLSSDQMEVRQESLARNELILFEPVTIAASIARIQEVTPAEVKAVAKEMFHAEKESVIIVARNQPRLKRMSVFV